MGAFTTKSRDVAERKIKELYKKRIISDVIVLNWNYTIQRLSQKDFYNNCVEEQKDMDGYLTHLIEKLGVSEEQEKEAWKELETKDLSDKLKDG